MRLCDLLTNFQLSFNLLFKHIIIHMHLHIIFVFLDNWISQNLKMFQHCHSSFDHFIVLLKGNLSIVKFMKLNVILPKTLPIYFELPLIEYHIGNYLNVVL